MKNSLLYIKIFEVIALIIYLFINKSTRKIAFRILKSVIIRIAVIAVIGVVCFFCTLCLKIVEILFVGLVGIDIYIFIAFLYNLTELVNIIKLHRKGCQTFGTITNSFYGLKGRYYDISYYADNQRYKYRVRKWKIDYDKISILYDPENPEKACLENYDLVSAISFIITFALLDTVFTVSTIYWITYLI